ncbi:MAG TPA: hypothetical protein VJT50_01885 [Pyrinomonadaceae bacterium]|nr:hypothetical protein [Pyrinomonadaceae bacterium]
MKKRTRRLLGGFAVAAGAVGAAGAFISKKKKLKGKQGGPKPDVWARPGMTVTFRAELMPGREREERTARVKELLPSGRVTLFEISGEHAQREFEAIQ